MKVITKYISKQVITIFLLCQLIFVFLYLVIDIVHKIDDFAKADVQLGLALLFFLYKIPTIVMEITPAATIISVIVVICQMKKNKEVMAMKACGINLHLAFFPVIIISFIISIFSFFLAEMIVPYTFTRSEVIMETNVRKRTQVKFLDWYKSKNNIYWIRHFDTKTNTIDDPIFYFFNDQFTLTKKVSGETCRWLDGIWEVENAKILTLKKDNTYRIEKQPHYLLKIPETPETFIAKRTKPEDMSYAELKKYAKRAKASGYDNTRALVDLYMKISYPFMSVVLALIAIPIGLWEKIEGIPLSITLGFLIVFLFWVIMSSANALGLNGTLPPLLSAWSANALFTFLGIYFLMDIKK